MPFKIFKKKKKSFTKEHSGNRASFFWLLLLCMMGFSMIISFVFGFLLFRKVNKEPVFAPDDTSRQVETVSREKLKAALQYFDDRAANSDSILNSPSPVDDPSL